MDSMYAHVKPDELQESCCEREGVRDSLSESSGQAMDTDAMDYTTTSTHSHSSSGLSNNSSGRDDTDSALAAPHAVAKEWSSEWFAADDVPPSDKSKLVRLLALLYRRSIFVEFRRPVLVSYPQLTASYLEAVRKPMDLGTLLCAVQSETVASVEDTRRELERIAENTIVFNSQSNVQFVSIARHLNDAAEGLFESIFQSPYHSKSSPSSVRTVDWAPGPDGLLQRERSRWARLRGCALNVSEVRELQVIAQQFQSCDRRASFVDCAVRAIDALCLATVRALEHVEDYRTQMGATVQRFTSPVTVGDLLAPVLRCAIATKMSPEVAPSSSPSLEQRQLTAFLTGVLSLTADDGDHSSAAAACLKSLGEDFLQCLRLEISVWACLVSERCFRGELGSSLWCTPHSVMLWSQFGKDSKGRNPWTPCTVLASCVKDADSDLRIADHVCELNIKRIPPALVKDLLKMRPRLSANSGKGDGTDADESGQPLNDLAESSVAEAASRETVTPHIDDSKAAPVLRIFFEEQTESTPAEMEKERERKRKSTRPSQPLPDSFAIPESYVLIEYFGKHELSWKRIDQTLRVQGVGLGYPGTGGKIANNDVLAEFEATLQSLTERIATCGEPTAAERDLQELPSIQSIEQSVAVPESSKKRIQRCMKEQREAADRRVTGREKNTKAKKTDVVDVDGHVLSHIADLSKLKPGDWQSLNSKIDKLIHSSPTLFHPHPIGSNSNSHSNSNPVTVSNRALSVSKWPTFAQVETDIVAEGFHSKIGLNVRRNALAKTKSLKILLLHTQSNDFVERDRQQEHQQQRQSNSVAQSPGPELSLFAADSPLTSLPTWAAVMERERPMKTGSSKSAFATPTAPSTQLDSQLLSDNEADAMDSDNALDEEDDNSDEDPDEPRPKARGRKARSAGADSSQGKDMDFFAKKERYRTPDKDQLLRQLQKLRKLDEEQHAEIIERGCWRFMQKLPLYRREKVDRTDSLFHREHILEKERSRFLQDELLGIDDQINLLEDELNKFESEKRADAEKERERERELSKSKAARNRQTKKDEKGSGQQSQSQQQDGIQLPAKVRESLPGKVGLIAKFQTDKRAREEKLALSNESTPKRRKAASSEAVESTAPSQLSSPAAEEAMDVLDD